MRFEIERRDNGDDEPYRIAVPFRFSSSLNAIVSAPYMPTTLAMHPYINGADRVTTPPNRSANPCLYSNKNLLLI
jgi:hypothetical protein